MQVPESPAWLTSQSRFKDALKALQWLRGCVSPQTVHKEFTDLQEFNQTSQACLSCSKQSLKCYHSMPTFFDKIKEIKRKRNLKPFFLMFCLHFFDQFCGYTVWQPYIIQVLNANGTPLDANLTTVITSGIGIVAIIFLGSTVKFFGRRKIYLTSTAVLATCCFGLSTFFSFLKFFQFSIFSFQLYQDFFLFSGIYGFILLPPGWMSFKTAMNDENKKVEYVHQLVGNYGWIAFALILIMQFSAKIGPQGQPNMFVGEVFPYK